MDPISSTDYLLGGAGVWLGSAAAFGAFGGCCSAAGDVASVPEPSYPLSLDGDLSLSVDTSSIISTSGAGTSLSHNM